jgi:hypothetical protein
MLLLVFVNFQLNKKDILNLFTYKYKFNYANNSIYGEPKVIHSWIPVLSSSQNIAI